MVKKVLLLSLVTISAMALTLDESVDLALKNSTKLSEIKLNKDISKLNKEQKRALSYGEFSLVGGVDHYNLPRTLAPITPSTISPNTPSTQDLFSVGVNYSVALFSGYAQTRSIEMEALQEKSSMIMENLTKEQIIYNVKNLYLSLSSLSEQVKSLDDYYKAQSAFVEVIKEEVKLGKKAYIDELKAKNDLESIRASKQKLLTNIEILQASLKYFTNHDIDKLEDVEINVVQKEFEIDKINNLDKLRVMNLALKSIEKKVAIKEAANYPQVSFNAYMGENFGFNDSTNINEGDFENEELWQVGIKVKYNLYDFGNTSSSIESAKLQKLQNQIKIEDTKREIQKDIASAISKLNESIANYESALSQYELLSESADIEQVRYESGSATINDLLLVNAQKELAKSKMIDSKYSYQKAIYYIEYILEKGNK